MNINLELATYEAELQSLYDNLTDEFKSLNIVNQQMCEVENLITKVRIAGFTGQTEDMIRACEGFTAFSSLGVDKTIKYKANESLGEAAWQGLVKFFEFIKGIVAKVYEIVTKLLGTTESKAKQILEIKATYDPALTGNVSLPTRDTFVELNYMFNAMSKICNKYLYTMEGSNSKGVVGLFEDPDLKAIVDPNGRVKMEENGNINIGHYLTWYYSTFTNDKTAAEHGYGPAVVFKICDDYLKQARSFTDLGAKINKMANAVAHKITTSRAIIEKTFDTTQFAKDGTVNEEEIKRDWTPEELKEERKAYLAYTSLYKCCARLQKEKAYLIQMFYRAVPK